MADQYQIIRLDNLMSSDLIHDIVVRPLRVNRDPRGTLTEALKVDWDDVYSQEHLPFKQMYFSTTDPGVARDKDQWHFHPGGQRDRFGVIRGDIVVAVLDKRDESPTKDLLNLFWMGESLGDNGQYLLVIPERTLHGFVVVSDTPATLFNFPTRLYDPAEEVRVPMAEAVLKHSQPFSWDKVVEAWKAVKV